MVDPVSVNNAKTPGGLTLREFCCNEAMFAYKGLTDRNFDDVGFYGITSHVGNDALIQSAVNRQSAFI